MRHFAIQMHNNGNDGSALIFVRGMHGTGVAFAVHEQRVCLYCCVCDCIWRCYELVFDTVWGHDFAHMRHFVFCCPNALQWRWWLCVDLRLFDAWNGYWVGPKPTARTFLLLRVCSNLTMLLVFGVVWGHNLTLDMCCPNTLQWRWWFCVDLRSLNGWQIVPERTGCTFALLCACALELERVSGFRYSIRSSCLP